MPLPSGSYKTLDEFVNATQAVDVSAGFELQNDGPIITFAQSDVQPPGDLYLGLNDMIEVQISNSRADVTEMDLRIRFLLADGTLKIFNCPCALKRSDRFFEIFNFTIAEGFILSAELHGVQVPILRGQLFANVLIVRGALTVLNDYQVLMAGYPSSGNPLAWPPGRFEAQNSGEGWLNVFTTANPAPGADVSITVPQYTRWKLKSVLAALTTSAAVANRQAFFNVEDGATTVLSIPANFVQTASLSVSYQMAACGVQSGAISNQVLVPIPLDFPVKGGWRLITFTKNLDAADQWQFISTFVEELIEVDS